MCEQHQLYGDEAPPVIIGGPTGDYKVFADITSAKWVEYRILSISFSGAGSVVISGNSKPAALDYSGGTTLNNDNHSYGEAYSAGGSGSQLTSDGWRRITHSEKRVFVRIDTVGAIYVSIQFRPRLIDRIPGPAHTVHPNEQQKLNEARAEAVRQRHGMTDEILKGEGLNARR